MRPTLIINRHDYSALAEEINPTWNDLDADGSGRDIHSGLMYRNKITSKLQLTVTMLDMYEDDVRRLSQDLEPQYVDATVLDPVTNKASWEGKDPFSIIVVIVSPRIAGEVEEMLKHFITFAEPEDM